MPIFRDKAIRTNADEVKFTISFTKVDVKRALISMCKLYYLGNAETAEADEWSEADLEAYFKNAEYKHFPKKFADMLARWAFKTAVRTQLITSSPNGVDRYLISDLVLRHSV